MKVTLVQAPANNPDSPPYALALLNAVLRTRGHEAHVFDLNIALYNRAKELGYDNVWSKGHSQQAPIERWIAPDFVDQTLAPHRAFIEEYVERILEVPSPVIGFSAHTSSFCASLDVARRIKQRDPTRVIIFGGPYCFLNHEGDRLLERHDFVDIVCFLEAEKTFPDLLDRMERGEDFADIDGYGFRLPGGRIRNNFIDTIHGTTIRKDTFIEDLDTIPYADWTCFDFSQYEDKYLPILTSRGCIKRCSFCSEAPIWGRYRYRSARNIADEIQYQAARHPHIKTFWFMDSLINGNIPMLSELCDILIARETAGRSGKERGNGKFGWTGQFLIRKEMTPEMWRKISLSGGQWFACGLENGSDHILKMMRKGYDSEQAKTVIRAAHQVDPDLVSVAMFVVGHPGETEEDFQDTLAMIRFLKELGVSSSVSTCDVRKGSHLWFNKEHYQVVCPPDDQFPEGSPYAWYSQDGTNTPEYRESLLRRTLDLDVTLLHTLKPGEHGLVEGGINVHHQSADIQDVAARFLKQKAAGNADSVEDDGLPPSDELEKLSRWLERHPKPTPSHLAVRLNRGVLLGKRGEYTDALSDLDAVVEHIDTLPSDCGRQPFVERGRVRRRSGDFLGALEDFNQALTMGPSAYAALVLSERSQVKWDLDDHLGALRDLTGAVAVNAAQALPRIEQAIGAMAEGNGSVPHDLVAVMDLANPATPALLHYGRGMAKRQLGDLNGACADFDKALDLFPATDSMRQFVDGLKQPEWNALDHMS